jgi:isoleucyl-tRNA synthetase
MAAPFAKVPTELNFPREEAEILRFWKEQQIFEKSLEAHAGGPTFVFYEGPPTANGLPHNGHVLTRVIKDLFPRYKTMRGYRVPRKAGWDTHGLPVEVEVEKELRIHGKAAIDEYGVEPFIARCIQSVFRYTNEWEKLTGRVAFWVDLEQAYVTYHQSYVESVWWALSELFKKGLLYRGHKVVWWWAQGGTALSSGEVGLGYKTVDDPSVFVAFPLKDEPDVSLLVWTTTPWTLPSNMYAAVHPEFDYAVVEAKQGKFIVAKGLLEPLSKKLGSELTVLREMKGTALAGKEYDPPFDLYKGLQRTVKGEPAYWRVIAADFVLMDASGIVHVAPAFGEDDFNAHKKETARLGETVDLLCAVEATGNFVPELTRYAGRWVKDCDKEIQHELKERGRLVHAEVYRHDYPFCWRADNDPLIQFARPAWYIKTTSLIHKAIENNRTINWLPDHIKEGRFGDFLANNVDWALSRERYWGTPLNVWINDVTGNMEAPSSVAEILKKNPRAFDHFHEAKKKDPSLSEHLIVHKPWIDQVTWQNPGEEGTYRRVPEVIDCWFDSGCMPFAQWGYPHKGEKEFKESFPADFISEAIDQTRGWFYSLLMISTLVFDEECQKRLGLDLRPYPHPFKTCIVLGHVGDKEGKKESKSKGNYTPPDVIIDKVGMEFAVIDAELAEKSYKAKENVDEKTAFIARDDYEGLDLAENGEEVTVRFGDKSERIMLRPSKKLPRRVILMSKGKLGATVTEKPDVKPVEVPQLPPTQRVRVEADAPAPGADAFRWFFYASNPPWSNTRHSLGNVRSLQKEFAVKLRNVYSFFTIYANIDGYDPVGEKGRDPSPVEKRSELDRWILSELALTTDLVTKDLDGYDVYAATQKLTAFVDALSNWYVRRSRDRFWRAGWDADKKSAYDTLYQALVVLSKLIAPFTPFSAEAMYRNLVWGPAHAAKLPAPESVHLTRFPEADSADVDRALSTRMKIVRDIVSVGLQVRTAHKLKVRQPLRAAHVILSQAGMAADVRACDAMIKEELNVLELDFVSSHDARKYVEYKLKPNFRTLGQRGLGKEAQKLKATMAQMGYEQAFEAHTALVMHGSTTVDGVELRSEDVEVSFDTKPGFAAAGDRVGVVVLETTLDEELKDLGFLRELISRVQTIRKELALEFTDRIRLGLKGGERTARVVGKYRDELAREVLAAEISDQGTSRELDVEGEKVAIGVHLA